MDMLQNKLKLDHYFKIILLLSLIIWFYPLQAQEADSGVCYASTGNEDGGRLIKIDPSSGLGTLIGDTSQDGVPAIAINSQGEIYSLNSGTGDIYMIDAQTGESNLITVTNLDQLNAIAFDTSDVLYGHSSYNLYTIDMQTGLSTTIGYIGYNLRGLAFNPLDNSLWGSGWWDIIKINTTDGSATLIGNTTLDWPLTDISFDIAGNLYATEGGISSENYFVSIDKSTGVGSRIGEIGFQSVSGLAFYNVILEGYHIGVVPEIADFGIFEFGSTPIQRTISISNIGSELLTVTNISTEDPELILSDLPALPIILPSRSSQSFDVSVSVTDTGQFNKTIAIASNDQDRPELEVQISGRAITIQPAENGRCYASTGNRDGGRLLQIDPSNGTGTLIGETDLEAIPALAINSEGYIYGVDENSGDIYKIDAATGFSTEVVQTEIGGLVAIAFDNNDVLYGFSSWESNLYTLNLQTGAATLIGYVGYYLKGLAFHPLNNTLWANSTYEIIQINPSDASATWIGNPDLNYPLTDLSFDISGNLFATAGGGQYDENYFTSINPSTAEGMIIGEIGFQSVSGLSFFSIPLEGYHLSISPPEINFNIFEAGDTSAVKLVSLQNIGTEILSVTGISTSDESLILNNVPVLPITLPSRSSQTFEVSVSVDDPGIINKFITITSNDQDNPILNIPINGQSIILSPAENGFCYASTGHMDGANLIKISPQTGSGTLIGNTNLDAVPAITINSEGWIYGLNETTEYIYKIDAETGYSVEEIQTDIEGLVTIAFDTSDVLYGFSQWSSELYTIDLHTGSSVSIGYIGYGLRGLAFHPLNNTLWGTDTYQLITINTSDASTTWIGNNNLNYPVTDLAFDISGNLFVTAGGGQNEENFFASIDKSTAQGTIIGEIGFQSVSGLAFHTSPLEGRHISVLPDTLDLITIEVGDTSYVKTIVISNIGTDVLTVTNISGSDATVILENVPELPLVLASRTSQKIDASVTVSDTGIFNKTVSVTSDDPDDPDHLVTLIGRAITITTADSGVWYASTGHEDGGRLISLDPTTGTGTLIGSTGLDAVPAIAINSKGKIYAIDTRTGNLHRLDAQSGRASEILNTNLYHITGLSFDNNDILYAYSEGSNSINVIDLKRGTVNQVGYTGSGFRGIAFNPIENSLVGIQWFDLYTINIVDGTTDFIGNTQLNIPITDIQFDILGNLYAVAGGNYYENNFVSLDKNTGTGSLIGEIGFETVSGLASYNVPLKGRHLSANPSMLEFGDIVVGDTSISRTLTIGNVGTEDLTIENLSLSDTTIILDEFPEFPLILSSLDFSTISVSIAANDTGLFDELITLSTDDPDNLSFEIPVQAESFSIFPADSGILYASTGNKDGGRLLKIDPMTGQGTLIGETGLYAVPGMAINSKGEIFGMDTWEGNLYRIDAKTGKGLFVGSTNQLRMIAIAFDEDDRLYGYSDNYGSLYEIDPKTGASEHLLDVGYDIRGMAFNPIDNSLWISRDDRIYTANISDGSIESFTNTGLRERISTINFDLLGNLYGVVHLDWSTSELFFLNTKNKQSVLIGEMGFESVSSLAYYNVPHPGPHLKVYNRSIDFGLTAVGDTSRSTSVDIFNVGTDVLIIDDISVDESSFIIDNISSLPWTLNSGENRTFNVSYSPVNMGLEAANIEISSNDSDHPVYQIGMSGEGSDFTIDGSFEESGYAQILPGKLNNNSGFGPDVDVTNIYYASDEEYFILGIECSVQNGPNQYNEKPDGLGIFLNFNSETGMPAGEPLGYWEDYDYHFLNGSFELSNEGVEFRMDFQVDYILAIYSDGTSNVISMDASTFIWDNSSQIQHIGSTNQSGNSGFGPLAEGVFSETSIEFAFQGSNGSGSKNGIEIKIPLSEINAESSDMFQIFATMVSASGFFSNVSVPGDITVWDNPGFDPNFYTNEVDDDCACPNPGATIGSGPYHSDWNTIVVGINDEGTQIPKEYALNQNYPNPFNPLTTIEYQLPEAAEIELVVYNILGQEIYTLINEKKVAGYHSQVWNAKDRFGNAVASGLYIYRLDAKGISGRKFVQVKKMVVLK